jgi:antitoxin MazE
MIATNVYTMYTHDMKTVIRTWGNSLAIRIPKVFALQMGIDTGKEVDLLLEKNGLHIASPKNNLHDLLRSVTSDNRHGETQTGAITGKEVW